MKSSQRNAAAVRLTTDQPAVRPAAVRRLLVRAPNWIGDAVMCEPALAALRTLFPSAEITLLARAAVAELFGAHPVPDRILVYDSKGGHAGLAGKWRLASMLRSFRFDLAVLFQNAFEAALIAWLAGVPRRHGYATDGRGLLLTGPVPAPSRRRRPHQVRYYLDLLEPLGCLAPARPPQLHLRAEEEAAASRILAEAGIGPDDPLVGLNPGSTYGVAKRWLPERFAEAADRVLDRLTRERGRRAKLVIVGAAGEEAVAGDIARRMQTRPVVLTGRTSIRELMAVIKRCGLFVSNDTGPMHVAAAFGVPLVAIFGPTDPQVTAPFGSGHALVRQPVDCAPCHLGQCPIDHRCMTGVTVEAVVAAALDQVRGAGAAEHGGDPAADLRGVTVFLDRDGTINEDTGYVKSTEEFRLLPGVVEALVRLKRAGARVVVVTNQSGVARGLIAPDALERIHERLRETMRRAGAPLDGLYACPHHPAEGCACRKPRPGLVERAAADLGLDLSVAYVVGDQPRDMQLARRIGARAVLVLSGPASSETLASLKGSEGEPDHVATGLREAADWIMADRASRRPPSADEPARSAVR